MNKNIELEMCRTENLIFDFVRASESPRSAVSYLRVSVRRHNTSQFISRQRSHSLEAHTVAVGASLESRGRVARAQVTAYMIPYALRLYPNPPRPRFCGAPRRTVATQPMATAYSYNYALLRVRVEAHE